MAVFPPQQLVESQDVAPVVVSSSQSCICSIHVLVGVAIYALALHPLIRALCTPPHRGQHQTDSARSSSGDCHSHSSGTRPHHSGPVHVRTIILFLNF